MALASIGQLFWPDPNRLGSPNTYSGAAALGISGGSDRTGWIFSVPMSGTITKVGLRINTLTTAKTSRLGIYTVSSGNPTTTGYGSSSYGTFTPAASTYAEVTLGASATATVGDIVAFMVDHDNSGDPGNFAITGANGPGMIPMLPTLVKTTDGSTWSRSTLVTPIAHIYYSDNSGTYPDWGAAPFTGTGTAPAYASGTNPNQHATKLVMPFKCRVIGVWHNFYTASTGDYEAAIYSGTSAVASATVTGTVSTFSVNNLRAVYFTAPTTVNAGDTIRASIKATGAGNVTGRYYPLYTASAVQSLGVPQSTCRSTRNGGAWTDDTTTIPAIGLIIDQLDDGVSAGGLLRHPGMAGGYSG